jgi:hypothetical protein
MGSTVRVERAAAVGPPIDVLAFPPTRTELQRWQLRDGKRWRELERRARVALFFGIGMFLAWAADVGAAFEVAGAEGSTLFGVASVPIAIVVVVAHLYGQWTLERSNRGLAELAQYYADVTLRDAAPLLALARKDAVVAQYLRCVGREGRPLLNLERIALYAWIEDGRREQTGAG